LNFTPDKNLFIVTSALQANIGVVDAVERLKQTITTLENLKEKVPDAMVLLVDGSPHNIDEGIKKRISEYCRIQMFMPWLLLVVKVKQKSL